MSAEMTLALTLFTVGFAIVLLGMGALVAYYGSKKTRNAGFGFILLGLLATCGWYYQTYVDGAWIEVAMPDALLAIVGGFTGAIVGVIIFLYAIIKS
jgi:hypothetical protein